MDILLFEDFNQDDVNNVFIDSINECISANQRCIDEFGEESDHMDMIGVCNDCIYISHLVKDLIDNESKLLKAQCQIYKLSLKACIDECKKFDDESCSSCIESCKRCVLDCEKILEEN